MTLPAPQGYYAAFAHPAPTCPALPGDMRADVCVVGGGYTGLSAALHLAEAGARVVLLEGERIGFGASGRNGGQLHSGHRQTQAQLEAWLGKIHARALWELAEDGKATVRGLIERHEISCALKDGLVIAAHNEKALAALAEDTAHLNTDYGYSAARMMDAAETASHLSTSIYAGGQFDAGGGHLQPLDYAHGLAKAAENAGALLFEHSHALRVDGTSVVCAQGTVTADHVLLACDAFSASVAPELAPYIAHVESFIIATAPMGEFLSRRLIPSNVAVADTRHVLDYYRKSTDGRLLFAGRESYFTIPKDIGALVRPRMLKVFPMLRDVPIDYAWHGTVGITRTRMPHFGRIGERVLFAHGYSGHGVALATLGGKLMAEAALGRPEKFDVFAKVPPKKFPGGAMLRKPLVAAGLLFYKWQDSL
ncbi:MAG TPA: FAD-binding oxidoreductase [Rhizomicrobium sp.]|nr:FAD-binding oxidoreductase [Rhizomicrobium sp.]